MFDLSRLHWIFSNNCSPWYFQVETRDVEIDRLSRMLEGGRPYDVVALEARNRSNERLISHLNIQVCKHTSYTLYSQFNSFMPTCIYFPPASAVEGIKSVRSVCLCVCPLFSAITGEPFNVRTWNSAGGMTLMTARMSVKVKVIGQRSRSARWKTWVFDFLMVWPVQKCAHPFAMTF